MTDLGAVVSFTPTRGGAPGAASINVWDQDIVTAPAGQVPNSPIHLAVSTSRWDYSVWTGHKIRSVRTGPLNLKPGVRYTIHIAVSGDTATITLPDGVHTVTDPAIASQAGNVASWEIFQNDAAVDGSVKYWQTWAN